MHPHEIYELAAILAIIASLIFRSFWRGYVQTEWGQYYAKTHTRRFRKTVRLYSAGYVLIMLAIAGVTVWFTYSPRP